MLVARDIRTWFCCMPGVRVKLLSFSRPAAAVLVHPDMPPAILSLETGELREIELEPVMGERVPGWV